MFATLLKTAVFEPNVAQNHLKINDFFQKLRLNDFKSFQNSFFGQFGCHGTKNFGLAPKNFETGANLAPKFFRRKAEKLAILMHFGHFWSKNRQNFRALRARGDFKPRITNLPVHARKWRPFWHLKFSIGT